MRGSEVWSLDDYRKHFGIKQDHKPPPVVQAKKKEEPKPDGIIEANGQTKKFRNKKVRIDGIVFDSIKEGDYYKKLKIQKATGFIKDFEVHKKYVFIHNGIRLCSLTVDFNVFDWNDKEDVIDVKSYATRMKKDYQIRKKMLKAFYGIDLIEA